MEILKASVDDFVEVFYLLRVSIQEMDTRGWLHLDWQNDAIIDDVKNSNIFLCRKDEKSLGFVLLTNDLAPEHKTVQWDQASKKPLTVKYLVVHPFWQNRGVRDQLLTFAEQYAKDSQYTSLRLSVFTGDESLISLFNQLNYRKSGEISYSFPQAQFYCYEKLLY